MKLLRFIAPLLFSCVYVMGQNANIDSLLNESYKAYSFYDFDKALELAQQVVDLAEAADAEQAWMIAQFYREIAFQVQQGDNYNIDTIQFFRDYFNQKKLNDEEARAHLHLARIYYYFGDVKHEVEQYITALNLYKELNDESGMSAVYSDLSLMYYDQHDYDAAFDNIRKAIAIDKVIGDPKKLHRDYNNLAIIFEHTGPIDSAIAIHVKALDYGYKSNDPYSIGLSLSNLGNNYAINEQFDLAKVNLFKALRIRDSIGNNRGLAYTNVRLGYMFIQLSEPNIALKYAKAALYHAEKTSELKIKRMSYRLMVDVAYALNDIEQELFYFKKAAALEDSIRNSDNTKEITKVMMRHEFAQQSFTDSAAHFAESLRLKNEYDQEIMKQSNVRNIAIISSLFTLLIALGLYRRSQFVKRANQKLQAEKNRSDELLLNILPAEVAEELKLKGESEARDFDDVTVLFTDFQEFTQTAEKLTAKELVTEINICFMAFDDIIQKYQIEKIKTIGDAYMAAGGLHRPRTSEPKDAVKAALEMQAFMLNRKTEQAAKNLPAFDMRVGIHTGPVVAGIVGVKKFQYDIWGDTVNTASRMESSGKVGKVNISQATYELLKDDPDFVFESRGKIKAKGKGEMEMWFVSYSANNVI